MEKKVLFVVYQSPVGSIWVNEGFRTAFGMYGEDIEPAVMLIDAATVALSKDTKPESLGLLSIKIVQRFIKRYKTPVYAVKEDLEKYNVKNVDEEYGAQFINKDELSDFFHQYDLVIFMWEVILMALVLVKYGINHPVEKLKIESAKEDDSIVLIQDGVYWNLQDLSSLTKAKVYILKEDFLARGYKEDEAKYNLIDYDGFVELIEKEEKFIG